MKNIVLASSSPRRKEILEKTGLSFIVDPSNFEENMDQNLEAKELVKTLSLGKAKDVAQRHPNSIIIAADVIITFEGKIFGKPKTKERTIEMLTEINGKCHSAITGFSIIDTTNDKTVTKSVETKVYFRNLTAKEIENYVNSGESINCAGGYTIQGKGAMLIRKIDGDYYNVLGLPLCELVVNLKDFGIKIL